MGSDTLDVEGFLVRVATTTDADRNFLHNLQRRHPEVFDPMLKHTTIFMIKNSGLGLFILDRLYERFQPLCSVQALIPFSRWMLPEKIKEVAEERCRITKKFETKLEGVKYAPKIIAISKSE